MNKLIENYITKINKNDINNFALKNNITLTNKEIDILYLYLKKEWKNLLYGNKENTINKIKKSLNNETFEKCNKLFDFYLNKYQSFL